MRKKVFVPYNIGEDGKTNIDELANYAYENYFEAYVEYEINYSEISKILATPLSELNWEKKTVKNRTRAYKAWERELGGENKNPTVGDLVEYVRARNGKVAIKDYSEKAHQATQSLLRNFGIEIPDFKRSY